MKLRNKKTGGLANIIGEQEFFRVYTDAGWADYSSLAELNEEWEDYEPKEPLIKDERIRKAVRAWAEVEGETQVQVTHCRKHILSIWSVTKENGNIDFDCDIEDTFDEGFYSINQLCGEEEE